MRTGKELAAAYAIVRRSKEVGPALLHIISMLNAEVEYAVKRGRSDDALRKALDEADQAWRGFANLVPQDDVSPDGFQRWLAKATPETHAGWQSSKTHSRG